MNETAKLRQSKNIAGIGRVVLWRGGSLWIGRDAGKAESHAHHAIQVSLALTDTLCLYDHEAGSWAEYSGAIVLPHRRHQFDGGGKSVAHIFVEPETVHGQKLMDMYSGAAIQALPVAVTENLIALLGKAMEDKVANENLIAAGRQGITLIAGVSDALPPIDPRITKAIEFTHSRIKSRITLAAAANAAHLSPSRFRHLFMAQTGISFRGYLLWSRVASAIAEAMSGVPWIDAAQNWGFADSAHLSRTCRRMFGVAPSMLIKEKPDRV